MVVLYFLLGILKQGARLSCCSAYADTVVGVIYIEEQSIIGITFITGNETLIAIDSSSVRVY